MKKEYANLTIIKKVEVKMLTTAKYVYFVNGILLTI